MNKKFDFLSAKSTKFSTIIFHSEETEFSENQQNYLLVIPGLSPKKYFFDSLCEWRSWSNRAGLDSACQIGAIFGNIFQQNMWSRAGQPKTTLWTAFKKIIKNSVFSQFWDFPQLPNFFKKKNTKNCLHWNPLIEHSPRILRRTGNPKMKKKPFSDHQRNLIRENSFIYCRAVDRTSRFSFLFW